MNLAEMLIYADINQINNIADNYQCQCDRHSKTEMIQSIIYKVLEINTIKKVLSNIELVENSFIKLLYLDAKIDYTAEDLIAKANQAIQLTKSSIKPKELVLIARKKGWVFQGVGRSNLLLYRVPEDLKRRILSATKDQLEESVKFKANIDFYRDENQLFIADLANFLNFIIKEEVLLTGDGNIYKRQQGTLLKQLHIQEQPLKKVAWRFGFGRRYNEYPDRFSLIYDYAYYKNLIFEDEQGELLITPAGGKWLKHADVTVDEIEIYRFYIRLYKNAIPYLQVIIKLIDLVAYQRWVQLNSIKDIVMDWIEDYYYEDKHKIFSDRIIKMLLHLGIIQIGNEDNQVYIRVTNKGHKFISELLNFDIKGLVME